MDLRVCSCLISPPCVRHDCANTSSFQSIASSPVEGGLEEVQQVARVHLAGVVAELGGKVDRTDDLPPWWLDGLARAGEFAVATLLGRNVHNSRSPAASARPAAREMILGAGRRARKLW